MSRFSWQDAFADDKDANLGWGRWTVRRNKVLNGKPGKLALAELEKALVAMPHKRLIEGALCDGSGVCVVGAWIYRRWVDVLGWTPAKAWKTLQNIGKGKEAGTYQYWERSSFEEWDRTVEMGYQELGITRTLVEVVSYVNDEEEGYRCTPEVRYDRVLAWVREQLK